MKKAISILLSLVMVFSLLSVAGVGAFAKEEFVLKDKVVKSVTAVAQYDIYEGLDNYENYDDQDRPFNYYDYEWIVEPYFTVEFTDGTVEEGSLYSELFYDVEDPIFTDDQSADNEWGLGEHIVNVSFLGEEFTMTVNVVENPIASIEAIAETPLYDHFSGNSYIYDDSVNEIHYFKYQENYANCKIEVEFTDGTNFVGSSDELSELFGRPVMFDSDQDYNNEWGIGVHEFDVYFMGFSTTMEVEVVESIYKSISAVPQKSLVENVNGYMGISFHYDEEADEVIGEMIFYYDVNECDFIYTLCYADGTEISGSDGYIFEQTGIFPEIYFYQIDEVSPGTYEATVAFGGLTNTTEFEIIPAEESTIGDLNADGKVSVVDAKWVLQSVAGGRELSETQKMLADVNGDGKVSVIDAKWILQSVAGTRVLGGVG